MKEIYKGKFLSFKERDSWEYVERLGCKSAVVIIPVTLNNEVVLIEQKRVPLGRNVIEFPAGLVGDEGFGSESFVTAAFRELKEETGYIPVPESESICADNIEYFGEFCTSPGLSNEKVHVVRIVVEKDNLATPEDGITVHVVPLFELRDWLKEKSKTCEVSVKTLLYSLRCEDCFCEENCLEECCTYGEEDSFLCHLAKSFLDNMVGWTIAACISAFVVSYTIKEILNLWK